MISKKKKNTYTQTFVLLSYFNVIVNVFVSLYIRRKEKKDNEKKETSTFIADTVIYILIIIIIIIRISCYVRVSHT